MMFFPCGVDLPISRFPVLTFVVCFFCFFIYLEQRSSETAYYDAFEDFCVEREVSDITAMAIRSVIKDEWEYPCWDLYTGIKDAEDPGAQIRDLVIAAKPLDVFKEGENERAYVEEILTSEYQAFRLAVPDNLTEQLVYDPEQISFWNMLTSTFSHGDALHLGGNLLFFFAFAVSVEVILGHIAFALILIAMSVSTAIAYSLAVAGTPQALPTLGLSGIVFGMIALLAILHPRLNLQVFVYITILRMPALFIATWFIGWEIYYLTIYGNSTDIGLTAHVSGAATGAIIGGLYWLFRADMLKRLEL